jgi:hypothetical protein
METDVYLQGKKVIRGSVIASSAHPRELRVVGICKLRDRIYIHTDDIGEEYLRASNIPSFNGFSTIGDECEGHVPFILSRFISNCYWPSNTQKTRKSSLDENEIVPGSVVSHKKLGRKLRVVGVCKLANSIYIHSDDVNKAYMRTLTVRKDSFSAIGDECIGHVPFDLDAFMEGYKGHFRRRPLMAKISSAITSAVVFTKNFIKSRKSTVR